MRQYRGKTKNGCWVYGSLVELGYSSYILTKETETIYQVAPNLIEIDQTTVGQSTGLFDKNGNEIFEGDQYELICTKFTIVFYKGAFCAVSEFNDIEHEADPLSWEVSVSEEIVTDDFPSKIEIIGNIHDV